MYLSLFKNGIGYPDNIASMNWMIMNVEERGRGLT
jgi:hypothetical protein